jgi:hypothetical protein
VREIFEQWEPLTPREYIAIELCRRGFAAPGPHRPLVPIPVRKVALEPHQYLEAWRPGCLERDEKGQMSFQLLPPEFSPDSEEPK